MLRLSKGKRATGSIKSSPEDFKVEEITQNGTILKLDTKYEPAQLGLEGKEGEFAVFVLQKNNWNTTQALQAVAKKVHRGIKSVGFAGTKDKTARSTQLCSIFGADPQILKEINLKDVKINGAWRSESKIELGMLSGNHFTITIRNAKDSGQIAKNVAELNGLFPNYFGAQRFGTRKNNHEIGLSVLKGDFQAAVMQFLTDTNNETNQDALQARQRLAKDHDFTAALDYFPSYLKYERTILEYLSKSERNFANALKRLPRSLTLMLIHSVEDHIFNAELEAMIKEGRVSPQVGNVLGYETKEPTEFERNELEKLGLTLDSFKVKGMPELNSKGTTRVFFAQFKDFGITGQDDSTTVSFSLPSGSYATVFLDELVEPRQEATDKDKYD